MSRIWSLHQPHARHITESYSQKTNSFQSGVSDLYLIDVAFVSAFDFKVTLACAYLSVDFLLKSFAFTGA